MIKFLLELTKKLYWFFGPPVQFLPGRQGLTLTIIDSNEYCLSIECIINDLPLSLSYLKL